MSIRSVLRGGAPIDPFIARRILQLLPLGNTADERPVAPAHAGPRSTEASTSAIRSAESAQVPSRPDDGAHIPASTSVTNHAVAQGESLSEREGQILCLVADGLTNREIAERLFLSRHTVESHIKRIYRKLAVSSRTMAIRAGRARGVIE